MELFKARKASIRSRLPCHWCSQIPVFFALYQVILSSPSKCATRQFFGGIRGEPEGAPERPIYSPCSA